jgi:CysZ protein
VLRANRPLAVGFGAAVFVCFLVPLGAIVTMPAAVAGGALLSRRVLGPTSTGSPPAGAAVHAPRAAAGRERAREVR